MSIAGPTSDRESVSSTITEMRAKGGGLRIDGLPAIVASWLFACALVGLFASPVRAHGPTVEITASGIKPALLNLFVGTTVHFTNGLDAPSGVVVAGEKGTVESPVLEVAGEGWHYTFEEAGAYEIRVVRRPEAKMRIVVVPKPAS